ncbi:hypothetical protein [Sphaerisporangium siamense]|uniref:Uncharacterized protein n=1 Tax=Sphaerisporangium siamense TaxID=795645 RepID=A0A7W7D798_9ACTN|nr:hypothetical protein [Sphaerisporangium siamense]MBB4700173.1 hypothetical protein [Sphaerisporangium siamense]
MRGQHGRVVLFGPRAARPRTAVTVAATTRLLLLALGLTTGVRGN